MGDAHAVIPLRAGPGHQTRSHVTEIHPMDTAWYQRVSGASQRPGAGGQHIALQALILKSGWCVIATTETKPNLVSPRSKTSTTTAEAPLPKEILRLLDKRRLKSGHYNGPLPIAHCSRPAPVASGLCARGLPAASNPLPHCPIAPLPIASGASRFLGAPSWAGFITFTL